MWGLRGDLVGFFGVNRCYDKLDGKGGKVQFGHKLNSHMGCGLPRARRTDASIRRQSGIRSVWIISCGGEHVDAVFWRDEVAEAPGGGPVPAPW